MLPSNSDFVEIKRDARSFARWVREGVITIEQAKKDLLPTPAQWEMIREDHHAHVLKDMLRIRTETWKALVRLLDGKRQRESVTRSVSP